MKDWRTYAIGILASLVIALAGSLWAQVPALSVRQGEQGERISYLEARVEAKLEAIEQRLARIEDELRRLQ